MDVFVRPGDSFWGFSQLFRIPLQLIINSNRNINPATLSVGQRIQIPGFVAVSYQIRPETPYGQLLEAEISL